MGVSCLRNAVMANSPDFRFFTSLPMRASIGAGVSLLLLILVYSIGYLPPSSRLELMLIPFLVVPLGGALSGVIDYRLDVFRRRGGLRKTTADMVSATFFILLFVLAFTLGMDQSVDP